MDVVAGSVDVTTYFNLRLAADGTAATAITISELDLQYVRSGETPAAKVDATALAATNTAHTDNRAIEIDATDQPGLYRVDWPDAAFASGVREVILTVKHTSTFIEHLRVNLTPVPADVSRVLGTTLTEGAAGRLAGGVVKFFNVASPTGTVNSIPDAVAGANGGLLIAGSNAATTFATLTVSGATSLQALSMTTLTASGAVAFQSTFAVTTSTSLAALSATTVTFSGAVAFQSTFAVSSTVTFNAFTCSNAFTVSGATVLTGNVGMAAGLTITQSTSNGHGITITANGTGTALRCLGGSGGGRGADFVGRGGEIGLRAEADSGSAAAVSFEANGSGDALAVVAQAGNGASFTAIGASKHGVLITGGTSGTSDGLKLVAGSGGVGLRCDTATFSGAVTLSSTLTVSGATSLQALSMTTLTASGAVAFQSTFAVTTSTSLGALSCTTLTASGAVAFQSTFAVSGTTTLAGAVTATNASNQISLGADMLTSGTTAASFVTELQSGLATQVSVDDLPTNAELATALAAADDAVLAAIAALNNLSAGQILTTALTEAYAADGAAPTLTQAIMLILQRLTEFSIAGTTITVKKLDGSTTAATLTINDATNPTSSTRAT